MRISIGCDHAARSLKLEIVEHLKQKNIIVIDQGTHTDESTDYPIYAKRVSKDIQDNKADFGILICGTGVGMSIAANKQKGIRAVVTSDTFSARASREHNNANVLCFGARVVGSGLAKQIVDEFLSTTYEGGRHDNRVLMLKMEGEK